VVCLDVRRLGAERIRSCILTSYKECLSYQNTSRTAEIERMKKKLAVNGRLAPALAMAQGGSARGGPTPKRLGGTPTPPAYRPVVRGGRLQPERWLRDKAWGSEVKDGRLNRFIEEFDRYSTRHLRDVLEAVCMIIEARKSVCEALGCLRFDDHPVTHSHLYLMNARSRARARRVYIYYSIA
jgi:hypothetical protein